MVFALLNILPVLPVLLLAVLCEAAYVGRPLEPVIGILTLPSNMAIGVAPHATAHR